MEKILIFTNLNFIWKVDSEIESKIKGISNLRETNPIHKFENRELTSVKSLQDGEIFFLIDSMTQDQYNIYLNNREEDILYILYHLNKVNDIPQFKIKFDKKFEHPIIGKHIKGVEGKYIAVIGILTGEEDDKKKRIIDLLFKNLDILNAALEFLHRCLVAKPTNLSQLKDFDKNKLCITGKAQGQNINGLWGKIKPKPLDDIDALEALRDGVLEMAEVK